MRKSKKTRLTRRGRKPERSGIILDATPERLAKSEFSDFVNPAEIDSCNQHIGRARRFADSCVDRLYRRGKLTYAQWYACGWYIATHSAAFDAPRVVADYGTSAGFSGALSYGQPRTERQLAARQRYRAAREQLPPNMVQLVEGVIIDDVMPSFLNGQQRDRFAQRFARAVQPLAVWLEIPGSVIDEQSVSA